MSATRTAIYARLAADATLTALLSSVTAIYHAIAPAEAVEPFVVFSKQAGTPRWSFAGNPLDNEVWLAKGITRSPSASVAEDIAARLDVVLTDAPLTITGRNLLWLRRESDVDYGEVDGGERWNHVGGFYRVITEQT